MGALIDQHVRKVSRERLGNDEVCHIAIREQQSGFHAEEPGQPLLQLAIERVIAGGHARGKGCHA